MSQRILVVDDERQLVDTIRHYLNNEGFETESAFNGNEAMEKFPAFQPDLVLLDMMMPEKNGLETLKELKQLQNVPVIFLTAKTEEVDKLIGLELGADDYITKPFSLRELSTRIRVVLRRTQQGSKDVPTILTFQNLEIDVDRMDVKLNKKSISLTPTEYRILETMVRHPGRVFTRMQLLEVMGEAYIGYDRTLDTHISNLRKKLAVIGDSYVQTVYGVGYKIEGGS